MSYNWNGPRTLLLLQILKPSAKKYGGRMFTHSMKNIEIQFSKEGYIVPTKKCVTNRFSYLKRNYLKKNLFEDEENQEFNNKIIR